MYNFFYNLSSLQLRTDDIIHAIVKQLYKIIYSLQLC